MYFEDEKEDIIDENANLHVAEDGTVSWEDILNDDSNDLQFIDDPEDNASAGGQAASTGADNSVEFIQNDMDDSAVEYVDDAAPDIQNSDTQNVQAQESVPDNSSSYTPSDETFSDDFDIDKQLEQISMDGSSDKDEFKMPSKEKKKTNTSTLILAALVALCVMGGAYYYFAIMQNGAGEIPPAPQQTETVSQNDSNQNVEEQNTQENQNQETANIPVVNDDEVDTLKPEVKPKEEKKEVIDIRPTGRLNPFLPLQKYAKSDLTETFVQYDKVGIPAPPSEMGKKNEETLKMLTIAVSGIMYDETKPSAIITLDNNDYFVQKGDKLDDYRVVDIGRNFVTVALGKNLYKANVGEEFKITSKFYGSAQYIPQGQGGGRQYYSVSENGEEKYKQDRNKNKGGNRYVSEDEVIIKAK